MQCGDIDLNFRISTTTRTNIINFILQKLVPMRFFLQMVSASHFAFAGVKDNLEITSETRKAIHAKVAAAAPTHKARKDVVPFGATVFVEFEGKVYEARKTLCLDTIQNMSKADKNSFKSTNGIIRLLDTGKYTECQSQTIKSKRMGRYFLIHGKLKVTGAEKRDDSDTGPELELTEQMIKPVGHSQARSVRLGMCLPNVCSVAEVLNLFRIMPMKVADGKIYVSVTSPDLDLLPPVFFQDTGPLLGSVFFLLLFILVAGSTIRVHLTLSPRRSRNYFLIIAEAFSLVGPSGTWDKLWEIPKVTRKTDCLNGIRVRY